MLNGHSSRQPGNDYFHGDSAVSEFSLHLDSTEPAAAAAAVLVFRPGQQLTGRVRLRLLRPLKVRNLDLVVRGCGHVGWGLGGGHFVQDDEVYINDIAELVATGPGEVVTLQAGEHEFPFSSRLPHHLPSTFTGSCGSVAYSAKAVMQADGDAHGPWSAVKAFSVESLLELEDHSELMQPCIVDARMAIGGSRCVKASLSLPRRVYAPSEYIKIDATVNNRSRKAISRLCVGLMMECLYQAGGQQQHRETLLVTDRTDEYRIGHLEARRWHNVRLRIPRPVPPSGLPHCRLASVSYSLLFRAEVEGCAKDLNLRVPLVVGASRGNAEPEEPQPAADAVHRLVRRSSSNFQPIGSTEKLRPSSGYLLFDPAADGGADVLHAADSLY
ncbi:hypothetical protein BOX15_Mlig018407g2 [Macrostomum lignano]|uniref:Arrestin_C domain-containing protein n=2 Tax=Macrostomum lignano TaxID=282301 RepID=A0A1I8J881_9PLAT|nr:hypothetical protein BOX15_Mlig018407g2 [Macrostomum lignano]